MNEPVNLSTLSIGDKFIAVADFKKRTPTWEVLGKNEFNSRHGSPTRECKNLVTRERVSKSGRLKVIELPLKQIENEQ